MHAWSYGTGIDRTVFRRRLLDRNPVYWLLARIRSKPAAVWLFLGVSACIWVLGWWRFRREWLNEGVYLCTAIVINLVLRYWFAGEAARAIAENRKLGALELLLSTPLKIEDILRGQWLALKRQFLGALVAVLLVECLFMLAVVREAVPDEERLFWFALWIAGMLMLVADLATLYWVGMWQGLTARNPVRAAGGSLVRVLVVPWIGYGLVLLVVVLSEMGQRSYQSNPTWKFFLGLWFGIGIGLDFAFGAWARQKLLTEFRLAAQQQYDTRSDFWRSWFGSLKPHVSGVPPPRLDPEVRA
jgi:magnesium-transporting ATPase (P-type)